jgi:hypothetical protein
LLLLGLYTCLPDEDRRLLSGGETPLQPGQAAQPTGVERNFIDSALRYFGLADTAQESDVVGGTATGQTAPGAVPQDAVPAAQQQDAEAQDQQQAAPPQPSEQQPPADQSASETAPRPDEAPKQDQPAPPPQPEKAGEQPGAGDQSLQIPPDAAKTGNTGFIDGEWRSDKGLVDQVTKQPLQQAYRFDPQGNGEVVIRRADGVQCRAAARARMQGGQLSIDELGDPRCPDGRTFSRSQTECMRTPSGQTVCQGRNADGSTYRVGIERQQTQP